MSAIHYKFRSAKDYDTYRFEGAGIPVWELKNEIIEAKKLGKSEDFDLVITNAQTNQDYADDSAIIPRNTSVVVKRVPVQKGSRPKRAPSNYAMPPTTTALPTKTATSSSAASTGPLTGTREEDSRIQRMIHESSAQWAQSSALAAQAASQAPRRTFRPRGPVNVPPPSYVCFRCGQTGHYINFCPTNADPTFDRPRIKRTTGIPKAFLKSIDPERLNDPAAAILLTSEGAAVVATPNEQEWQRVTASRVKTEAAQRDIPEHLLCPICKDLLNAPMRVPCCGAVFCDDCISGRLNDSSTGAPCPSCKRPLLLEGLRPAEDIAREIELFLRPRPSPDAPAQINAEGVISREGIQQQQQQQQQQKQKQKQEQHRPFHKRPPPTLPPASADFDNIPYMPYQRSHSSVMTGQHPEMTPSVPPPPNSGAVYWPPPFQYAQSLQPQAAPMQYQNQPTLTRSPPREYYDQSARSPDHSRQSRPRSRSPDSSRRGSNPPRTSSRRPPRSHRSRSPGRDETRTARRIVRRA